MEFTPVQAQLDLRPPVWPNPADHQSSEHQYWMTNGRKRSRISSTVTDLLRLTCLDLTIQHLNIPRAMHLLM